ncbi:MAG: hypothetical protein JXB50_09935 [Spirochaetes bacterium]|nr:hypothetical protein [Spirochaetota bacterium]
MKKIAITGISLVTPLGLNKNENWNSIQSNISGITKAEGFRVKTEFQLYAGEIKSLINNKKDKWLQIFNLMMEDIKVTENITDDFIVDSGLSLGSAFLGMEAYKFFNFHTFINKIRQKWKFDCGININSNTCAAGNFALFNGANMIRSGYAKKVFCIGIDILSEYLFSGFYALRTISKGVSRPFCFGRDGLSLGEGGALIVLEDYEHAKKRGARFFCEYAGFGSSIDNSSLTGMDRSGRGIIKSFKRALESSNTSIDQIDLISAHGTGTKINDETEAKSIIEFFKKKTKITVFKSYTGHAMGASSIISGAFLCLSIKYGKVIKINNFFDPEFDLNYAEKNEDKRINFAVNNSFGFGGINSCLVLKGVNL